MNSEKIEIAKKKMENLYEKLKKDLYDEEKINKIKFYDDFKVVPETEENIGIKEDIYLVEKELIKEKDVIDILEEIYLEDGLKVGQVLKDGNIEFSEEYKELLQQRLGKLYSKVKIDDKKTNFKEIENNRTKEEIEEKETELGKEEFENIEKQKEQQNEEAKKENNQEQKVEQVAKASGMTKEQIKSCTKFDANQRITDSETFKDIIPDAKQYKEIYVVASNSNTKGNSKFHFVGVKEDEEYDSAEQIESMKPVEGVNTSKEIISINRDGSKVTEKQVSALFQVGNNKGFSVSIGDYGIIQAQYIRRTRNNEYIGIDINTQTQKPTTKEVKDFMDDKKNPYMQDNVDKAKQQLKEMDETHIKNIDDNENNDIVLDVDKEIKLSNGEVTTIRKEAEEYNRSVEEYCKEISAMEGNSMEEKIVKVNIEYLEKNYEEYEKENKEDKQIEEDKENIRTPWGDAYKRMNGIK